MGDLMAYLTVETTLSDEFAVGKAINDAIESPRIRVPGGWRGVGAGEILSRHNTYRDGGVAMSFFIIGTREFLGECWRKVRRLSRGRPRFRITEDAHAEMNLGKMARNDWKDVHA